MYRLLSLKRHPSRSLFSQVWSAWSLQLNVVAFVWANTSSFMRFILYLVPVSSELLLMIRWLDSSLASTYNCTSLMRRVADYFSLSESRYILNSCSHHCLSSRAASQWHLRVFTICQMHKISVGFLYRLYYGSSPWFVMVERTLYGVTYSVSLGMINVRYHWSVRVSTQSIQC